MSFVEIVRESWGNGVPDWVEVLAKACDRSSQNAVAKQLDRSAALVSHVLRARYTGNMAAVEEIVRGALMAETVPCPVLGDIGKQVCAGWRKRARSFSSTNSQTITMYRACHGCPVFTGGAE